MSIGIRVRWHDFTKTKTYSAVQALLSILGYRLVIMFDEQKIATDVYVTKIR